MTPDFLPFEARFARLLSNMTWGYRNQSAIINIPLLLESLEHIFYTIWRSDGPGRIDPRRTGTAPEA